MSNILPLSSASQTCHEVVSPTLQLLPLCNREVVGKGGCESRSLNFLRLGVLLLEVGMQCSAEALDLVLLWSNVFTALMSHNVSHRTLWRGERLPVRTNLDFFRNKANGNTLQWLECETSKKEITLLDLTSSCNSFEGDLFWVLKITEVAASVLAAECFHKAGAEQHSERGIAAFASSASVCSGSETLSGQSGILLYAAASKLNQPHDACPAAPRVLCESSGAELALACCW